jgi:hypothetical protein
MALLTLMLIPRPKGRAPSGIRCVRNPDRVDQIRGQGRRRNVLDFLGLLVNLESRRDDNRFLDRDRESDPAERSRLPIESVSPVAVLLRIRSADFPRRLTRQLPK